MASVLMASEGALGAHTGLTNNPHAVTKAQVGLGNVDNTADTNKPVSTAMRAALVLKQDKLSDAQMAKVNNALTNANAFDAAGAASAALAAHLAETNPHVITKEALGLGNVNNTSDVNKPISTATQTALNAKQDKLTAGDNITIAADGTISATGGGTPEDYEIVRTNAATGATHAAKTDNPHGVTAAQVGADAAGSAAAAKAAAIADAAGKYLPKTSVVAPSSTATTGQAADAKATYDELAKRVEMSPYGDITLTDGSATVQIYPYEIYFSDPSHNLVNYLAFPGYENDDTTLKREGSFDFLATRPWVDYQYLRKGDNAAGLTPTAKSALFASDGFFYPSAPAGSLAGKINTIESQLSGLADALAAL